MDEKDIENEMTKALEIISKLQTRGAFLRYESIQENKSIPCKRI
jgi:hypothetical protein